MRALQAVAVLLAIALVGGKTIRSWGVGRPLAALVASVLLPAHKVST